MLLDVLHFEIYCVVVIYTIQQDTQRFFEANLLLDLVIRKGYLFKG